MHSLYTRIPEKWRSRIILWIASFLFGLIIIWIWDIETLLVVLILLSLIAALFRTLGLTQALKLERWALDQFLGRIRGIVIFAILPAVWVMAKDLIENPSMSSALALILVLLLIVIIWDRFERIRKGAGKVSLDSSRRRH